MRIQVQTGSSGAKTELARLLEAAEIHLSEQLGARYYGPGLRFVVLDFKHQLPKGHAPRSVWRYRGSFAEHLLVEVVCPLFDGPVLSAESFRQLLELVRQAVRDTHRQWQGEFRAADFENDFTACLSEAPRADRQLREYLSRLGEARDRGNLRLLAGDEEHRRQTHRPCETPLAGIRWYAHGRLSDGRLDPQLTVQCRLVEGLLRNRKFQCPGYCEIYINVAETFDEARRNRTAIEDWHENAYAIVRWEDYEAASHVDRAAHLLKAIEQALGELAAIDHLNVAVIQQTVQQIRTTGTQTDITYLSASNPRYTAEVVYRVAEDGGAPYFRLEVVDRVEHQQATIDLGRRELWWLPYCFGRLALTAREIRIEGRNSQRAKVARKAEKRPAKLVFAYRDIFPHG